MQDRLLVQRRVDGGRRGPPSAARVLPRPRKAARTALDSSDEQDHASLTARSPDGPPHRLSLGEARVSLDVQATPHRLLPLQGLLAGLLAGAAVGVLARTWMRLITTDEPEFSVSGTLFIIGAFTVMGGVAGGVAGARLRGWRGHAMTALRATGLVAVLPLATGAGIVLAPTLLFGALAVGRTTWPAALRTMLAALAAVPVLAVHGQALRDGLGAGRALGALLLCLLIYGGLVLALAQSVRPIPGGSAVPSRAVALLLAGSAVLLVGLASAGVPGLLVSVLLLTGAALALLPSTRRVASGR